MSVGILLVTHNRIGRELLITARDTLGFCPVQTACLNVAMDNDPDTLRERASTLLQQLDTGEGVLILTDAYGSTPSNIATTLTTHRRFSVVAGVNLPMLLRVFNYPRLSLAELEEKALTGGQDGVILVEKREE
ncbi:MAG: hypothetical protein WED00_19535 [Aquisalimonadaceae bacterium]